MLLLQPVAFTPHLFVLIQQRSIATKPYTHKVLGRAHIHKGKKRVRRAKLYYLWEKRDPKEFAISG